MTFIVCQDCPSKLPRDRVIEERGNTYQESVLRIGAIVTNCPATESWREAVVTHHTVASPWEWWCKRPKTDKEKKVICGNEQIRKRNRKSKVAKLRKEHGTLGTECVLNAA